MMKPIFTALAFALLVNGSVATTLNPSKEAELVGSVAAPLNPHKEAELVGKGQLAQGSPIDVLKTVNIATTLEEAELVGKGQAAQGSPTDALKTVNIATTVKEEIGPVGRGQAAPKSPAAVSRLLINAAGEISEASDPEQEAELVGKAHAAQRSPADALKTVNIATTAEEIGPMGRGQAALKSPAAVSQLLINAAGEISEASGPKQNEEAELVGKGQAAQRSPADALKTMNIATTVEEIGLMRTMQTAPKSPAAVSQLLINPAGEMGEASEPVQDLGQKLAEHKENGLDPLGQSLLSDGFGQPGGTSRLGNLLNDWFLGGTCPSQPRAVQKGEGHGLPGRTMKEDINSRFADFPAGTLGAFLLSHPAAKRETLIPYCDGEWWWAYFYKNWAVLASQFQEDLRPKAMQFLKESTHLQIDSADTNSLVVHYRLGDPSGAIAPSALLKGVVKLYQQMSIPEPLHIAVLAGSYNHDVHDDDQKQKCETQHQLLIDQLKERFPKATINDTYGNADEDWLRMAFAPVLVTSHGSYAVTAAAVNTGYRATGGTPNLNNVKMQVARGDTVPSSITSGWITYELLPGDAIM